MPAGVKLPVPEPVARQTKEMPFSLARMLLWGPGAHRRPPEGVPQEADVKIALRGVNVYYGEHRALRDVYLDLYRDTVNALIGASGSGKSTLLRCLNRFIETVPRAKLDGIVAIDGRNVLAGTRGVTRLRRQFGMLVQRPNPFPRSIYENVAYGPRIHRMYVDEPGLDRVVRGALERVGLWSEVEGDLDAKATELSVGQQQRLCLARALAYEPAILLLDEPCAGLDPVSSATIEDLILSLGRDHTVVVATHSLVRAARISQFAAFMHEGRVVEHAPTQTLLASPREPATRAFIEENSLERPALAGS